MFHKFEVLIGTSGWDYRHWQERFYPQDVKSRDKLKFYSKRFNTVEINSSFYHLPKLKTFEKWYNDSGKDFIFSVKLNRNITHFKRLKLDKQSKRMLKDFLVNSQGLKEKLGAILIQLPPNLKFDFEKLKEFLEYCFKIVKELTYVPDIAIEFRNNTWFKEEVYKIFKKYNIGFVISHSSRFKYEKIITADFSYIRFHGPKELFASKYSKRELKEWSNFIKSISKKIKRIYIYFNNDYNAYAIDDAEYLRTIDT